MFQWSNKVSKSVTFTSELADQELLALIDTELAKYPYKTFNELCKEALKLMLRQNVNPSVRPEVKSNESDLRVEQLQTQVAQLEQQLGGVEQRLYQCSRDLARLGPLEYQINQLNRRINTLSLAGNDVPAPPGMATLPVEEASEVPIEVAPQEVDPAIARISQLIDDF